MQLLNCPHVRCCYSWCQKATRDVEGLASTLKWQTTLLMVQEILSTLGKVRRWCLLMNPEGKEWEIFIWWSQYIFFWSDIRQILCGLHMVYIQEEFVSLFFILFLPLLLRYNWHAALYEMYSIMIWITCIMKLLSQKV